MSTHRARELAEQLIDDAEFLERRCAADLAFIAINMREAAALLTGETAAASEAQLDALICYHCGADRLKTGCALRNIGDCKFIGKPQSAARPTAAQERKAVAWCSQNDIDLMLHMRTVEPEYGDFQITVTPSREDGRTIAIYTDPVNIGGERS